MWIYLCMRLYTYKEKENVTQGHCNQHKYLLVAKCLKFYHVTSGTLGQL